MENRVNFEEGAGASFMESNVRVLATYLPQFHRVKENDLWWGEGFTEWTAVRNSKPLFEGHDQPRVPLNNNYYNLLDKETMRWQANLAKQYCIDGFCFWHYWFENGRKILEKPAENLLMWPDIDMPFCFCWANETWARTWSNIARPNYWTTKYEPEKNGTEDGILLRQNYGTEKEWTDHFYYLLPFFKDERYIRQNGMPVFIIFRPLLVGCAMPMMECWGRLAKANGLDGIYLIAWGLPQVERPYDANIIDILQNANTSFQKVSGGNLKTIDYDATWASFLEIPLTHNETELLCGCVGYDTTPRNGVSGTILKGASVEKFQYYFAQMMRKSIDNRNPFVILNAWNEWAEGNYLEPDETTGFDYLKAVKKVKCNGESLLQNHQVIVKNEDDGRFLYLNKKMNKYIKQYHVMYKWLAIKISHGSIENFFIGKGYNSIAIYGWGDLGRLLATDLEGSSVDVAFIIDRRGSELYSIDKPVFTPDNTVFPTVDVVVISVVDEFAEIYDSIKGKTTADIVSLETIIEE